MKKLCFSLGIVAACIIGVGFLFYALSILNAAVGFKFFNRIFVNNGLMKNSADVLKAAFAKNEAGQVINLFGFDLTNSLFPIFSYKPIKNPSKCRLKSTLSSSIRIPSF